MFRADALEIVKFLLLEMFKQKPGTPWQRSGRIDSGKVWKYGVDIGLDDSGRGFNFRAFFSFSDIQ